MLNIKKLFLFHKKEIIMENINFNLKENEQAFIIGKSGIGKSTFFNALLDPKNIKKGIIEYRSFDLTTLSKRRIKKIKKYFFYISQTSTLIEEQSVFNNIYRHLEYRSVFGKIFGIIPKKDVERILSTLKKLNIFSQAFKKVKNLSGGQKQRVNIAIALLQKPNLLLADEPTTSLDNNTAKKVIQSILDLKKTSLIIIHQYELIPPNSRVIAFAKRKVIFDDKAKNLTSKVIKEIYE